MRINLLDLLQSNPIVHPTRIASMAISDGTLRIAVTGYPWWKPRADFSDDGQLEIRFEGLSDGYLDVTLASGDEDDLEALEGFALRSLENIDWAQPCIHAIYCSGPLQNPLAIYAVVNDYLVDVEAFKTPDDFLNFNFDGKLSSFAETGASNSFLVARAPESVRQIICEELTRQSVPYNVITTKLPPEKRLWVTLGDGHFLCDKAFTVFDK